MSTKRISGPHPLSCITCRERRKKCDRTHPFCIRCHAGGFTCRGYESRGDQLKGLPKTTILFDQLIQQSSTRGTTPSVSNHDTFKPNPSPEQLSKGPRLLENYTRSSAAHGGFSRGSASRSGPAFSTPAQMASSVQLSGNIGFTVGVVGKPPPTVRPTNCSSGHRLEVCISHSRTQHLHGDFGSGSSGTDRTTYPKNRLRDLTALRFGERRAPAIYPDLDSSVVIVEYITSQYERVSHMMVFELVSHQANFVRRGFLESITASKSSCWSLYLGAQIYHTLVGSNSRACIKPYIKQIDGFKRQLASVPPGATSTRELDGWLGVALEMLYARLVTDPHLAYRVLCNVRPIFLQITCSDSTLWPRDGSSVGVSLHNALLSQNPRIARYAIMDVVMSMLFGTPLLTHWDTTSHPIPSRQVVEWLPGCPPHFIIALAKVSLWRGTDAYTRGVNGWREIEKAVRGWSSPYAAGNLNFGSIGAIGRLAIQEALRHATLIYLYMGMCGLASGDSRVQESCRQVVQLSSLANAEPAISLHFFLPMVVAGICASKERHREIIQDVLYQARSCRVFLFQQTDFTGVLDHLWHGAAKNGADIFWDDYLASCRAVIKMEK